MALSRNEKISAGQAAMGTGAAAAAAIPVAGWAISGGLAIGSALMGLAKRPDDVGVDPAKRAALGVSAANMDRISSLDGMSQKDVGNIATLGDRSRAEGLAAINAIPVESLLDKQRIGQALMEHTKKVDTNIQDLVARLDPAAAAKNATATSQAAATTSNIASDINTEERLEREHREATNAANAENVANTLASFATALNAQLDMQPTKNKISKTEIEQMTQERDGTMTFDGGATSGFQNPNTAVRPTPEQGFTQINEEQSVYDGSEEEKKLWDEILNNQNRYIGG